MPFSSRGPLIASDSCYCHAITSSLSHNPHGDYSSSSSTTAKQDDQPTPSSLAIRVLHSSTSVRGSRVARQKNARNSKRSFPFSGCCERVGSNGPLTCCWLAILAAEERRHGLGILSRLVGSKFLMSTEVFSARLRLADFVLP